MAGIQTLAAGIAGMLSERFGGSTSYPATGHFGTQREAIVVIECFCREDAWERSSADLFSMAKALARHCEQESIACSLDGQMILVIPNENETELEQAHDRTVADLMSRGARENA